MGFSSLMIMIEVITAVVVVGVVVALGFWLRRATSWMEPAPMMYVPVAPMPWTPPPVVIAPATQIKKSTCKSCGALKVRPPRTACLYCDYCGALVDWDFRLSMSAAGSAQPGMELRRLMGHEKHLQAQARASGNRHGYRESLGRVYQQHMHACPAAYPFRIADPAYRSALVEFLITVDLEIGFDPQSQAHEAELERAIASLGIVRGHGVPPQVELQSFGRLLAAKRACTARHAELMAPHLHLHPDNPTAEIALAVIHSTFAQYWLPFLGAPGQAWLLRELGLEGEYVPIPAVATSERHCGGCGGTIAVVDGARRVVCEACGRLNEVGRPEIACPNCSAPVSIVAGVSRLACPYCRGELRVDAAPP